MSDLQIEIDKLELKAADLLAVYVPIDWDGFEIKDLAEGLDKANLPCTVLLLTKGMSVEQVGEEQMNALGWFRKEV